MACAGEPGAHREPRVPGTDDDDVNGAGGADTRARGRQPGTHRTSTATLVGLVTMSNTAERLCDCATSAAISSLRGVRVDVEDDLDAVEAVAHVAVDAEDALQVHAGFERGLDGAQLDLAILRDRSDAGREAGGEADEHVLHRRRAVVFGREDRRMVGVVFELGLVRLLGAQAEELLDGGAAVRAVDPAAGGAPLEVRRLPGSRSAPRGRPAALRR